MAMQAAASYLWGQNITGRRVCVAGLGNVGSELCRLLHGAGAELVVADLREDAVARTVQETGAAAIRPADAHAADVDIYAPCALGAGLNADTIPQITAKLICGAANNQLATQEDGDRLLKRGILYAPDYLVNAGGLISVARAPTGMDTATARAKLALIPDTLMQVFRKAAQDSRSPATVADEIAMARIAGV